MLFLLACQSGSIELGHKPQSTDTGDSQPEETDTQSPSFPDPDLPPLANCIERLQILYSDRQAPPWWQQYNEEEQLIARWYGSASAEDSSRIESWTYDSHGQVDLYVYQVNQPGPSIQTSQDNNYVYDENDREIEHTVDINMDGVPDMITEWDWDSDGEYRSGTTTTWSGNYSSVVFYGETYENGNLVRSVTDNGHDGQNEEEIHQTWVDDLLAFLCARRGRDGQALTTGEHHLPLFDAAWQEVHGR